MKSPPASLLEERSALPTNDPQQSAQTAQTTTTREKRFDWPLCYDAEDFVLKQIEAFLARNSFASKLSKRMRDETGTRLIDWVDYLVLSAEAEEALRNFGFADDPLGEAPRSAQKTLWHPEAMLPRVMLDRAVPNAGHPHALAIHVDSLSDFMAGHGIIAAGDVVKHSRARQRVQLRIDVAQPRARFLHYQRQ